MAGRVGFDGSPAGQDLPQATVVVPTRGDREDWLRSCLTSVVQQGHLVRCLVVGHRSARLAEICRQLNVELLDEEDRGMANAVNQGLAVSDTPFVTWIGDDDLLSAGSISLTSHALERNPDASLAFGQCRIINASGARMWTIRPGRVCIPLMRLNTQLIPQPGCLIRRAALEEVGLLDPQLRNPMDLDLFLRLLRWGPFTYVPHVLAAFRVHDDSLTTTNPNPGAEAREVRSRYLSPRVAWATEKSEPALSGLSKALARLQMVDPRRDTAVFND